MKWTLVYFDDQIQNLECMKELLAQDFNVVGNHDSTKYLEILEKNNPHIILLDVHMPVMDGHELYKNITKSPLYNGCPIVFISGDQSDENKIKSFEEGAIDFLSRDLKTEEIVARLKNKIKFFLDRSTALSLGNLKVDVVTMKASINEKTIDLTLLELRMLSSIMRYFPQTLTRGEMISKVWGSDSVKPGTVNTHLTNLKPKLEDWDHQIKVRDENILIQKKEIF